MHFFASFGDMFARQRAGDQDGKVLPNTRTAVFIKNSKAPVYIPLSGKTIEFGGDGKCTKGCR